MDSLPVRLFVSFTTNEQIKCERELSAFICVDAVVRRAEPLAKIFITSPGVVAASVCAPST